MGFSDSFTFWLGKQAAELFEVVIFLGILGVVFVIALVREWLADRKKVK